MLHKALEMAMTCFYGWQISKPRSLLFWQLLWLAVTIEIIGGAGIKQREQRKVRGTRKEKKDEEQNKDRKS